MGSPDSSIEERIWGERFIENDRRHRESSADRAKAPYIHIDATLFRTEFP